MKTAGKEELIQISRVVMGHRRTSLQFGSTYYVAQYDDYRVNIQVLTSEKQYKTYTIRVPMTPHYHNKPSNEITVIEFFVLPQGLVDEPCLAIGLRNGALYLVTVSGGVLFVFCGIRHPKFAFGAIQSIASVVQSRFVMAYAMAWQYDQGIAFLSQQALYAAIQAQTSRESILEEEKYSEPMLSLKDTTLLFNQKPYRPLIGLALADFSSLHKSVPLTSSIALVENTSVILLSPRPFLTKIVPFANNQMVELSGPIGIQTQLKQLDADEIPTGSCVSAVNEEFEYLLQQEQGKLIYSTQYKGQYIVDTLELTVGYLGGDAVEFKTPANKDFLIDKNSDLDVQYGKNAMKAVQRLNGDFFAKTRYRVPFCEYVVQNLPHVVALSSDGALLNVRIDLLDVIAVDYHLDYNRNRRYQLLTVKDTLYTLEQISEELTKVWRFELPSLVFRGVQEYGSEVVIINTSMFQMQDGQLVIQDIAE